MNVEDPTILNILTPLLSIQLALSTTALIPDVIKRIIFLMSRFLAKFYVSSLPQTEDRYSDLQFFLGQKEKVVSQGTLPQLVSYFTENCPTRPGIFPLLWSRGSFFASPLHICSAILQYDNKSTDPKNKEIIRCTLSAWLYSNPKYPDSSNQKLRNFIFFHYLSQGERPRQVTSLLLQILHDSAQPPASPPRPLVPDESKPIDIDQFLSLSPLQLAQDITYTDAKIWSEIDLSELPETRQRKHSTLNPAREYAAYVESWVQTVLSRTREEEERNHLFLHLLKVISCLIADMKNFNGAKLIYSGLGTCPTWVDLQSEELTMNKEMSLSFQEIDALLASFTYNNLRTIMYQGTTVFVPCLEALVIEARSNSLHSWGMGGSIHFKKASLIYESADKLLQLQRSCLRFLETAEKPIFSFSGAINNELEPFRNRVDKKEQSRD